MKTALVIGCASCVWDDVKAAEAMIKFDEFYCVKMAGIVWNSPHFIWATLHPEFMDDYEGQRRAKFGDLCGRYEIVAPLAIEVGTHGAEGRIARRVSYRWPGMTSSASSGIYGAKIALDDGYERVVLAGVPLETQANHFIRGKPWFQRDSFTAGFNVAMKFLRGKVRSMSGYTREVLGEPTPDWLRGDPAPVNSAKVQG